MKNKSYSRAAEIDFVVPVLLETRKFINTNIAQAHQKKTSQREAVKQNVAPPPTTTTTATKLVDPQYAASMFQTLSIVNSSKDCTPS